MIVTTTTTAGDILAVVTEIFTGAIGMLTQVATAITANPLLLFYAAVPFLGLAIGLFARLKAQR